MFTDVHFTNLTSLSAADRIAFFQKDTGVMIACGTVLKVIQQCQHGWSHTIRIPWDLNFRLVKTAGITTPAYALKTTYKPGRKKYILSKEGIITLQQDYGNGKQIIDVEQVKGDAYDAVRIYRGELPIAEHFFVNRMVQFQIDNTISVVSNYNENDNLAGKTALNFDLTGIKSIHIGINDPKLNQLIVRKVEQW